MLTIPPWAIQRIWRLGCRSRSRWNYFDDFLNFAGGGGIRSSKIGWGVQVKGVSRPVDAFEVVAATTARTRVQAAAVRGLTPLVGRRTEIEVFSKLVEEAGSGKGQILAMVGEPGLGNRAWCTNLPGTSYGRIGRCWRLHRFLTEGYALSSLDRNVAPLLPNHR